MVVSTPPTPLPAHFRVTPSRGGRGRVPGLEATWGQRRPDHVRRVRASHPAGASGPRHVSSRRSGRPLSAGLLSRWLSTGGYKQKPARSAGFTFGVISGDYEV